MGIYESQSSGAYETTMVHRISICGSFVRSLPLGLDYDIVIVDEADAIQTSLGSTMNDRYTEVVWRLQHIMRKANRIIYAQAALSEKTVYWASEFAQVDPDDRNKVQRCIITLLRKHICWRYLTRWNRLLPSSLRSTFHDGCHHAENVASQSYASTLQWHSQPHFTPISSSAKR